MKYNIKTIYLAGGCFWEVEAYISRLNGVIQTETGYANGITHDPTYEKVAAGKTKHVECVKVNYNTYETTLEEILKEFLKIIKKAANPNIARGGNLGGANITTIAAKAATVKIPKVTHAFRSFSFFNKTKAIAAKITSGIRA